MDIGTIVGIGGGVIATLATALAKMAWDKVRTTEAKLTVLEARVAAQDTTITELRSADELLRQHREADSKLLEATLDRMKMSVQLIVAKAGLKDRDP